MRDQEQSVRVVPVLGGLELVRVCGARARVPVHVHQGLCLGVVSRGGRIMEFGSVRVVVLAGQGFAVAPWVAHGVAPLGSEGQDYQLLAVPGEWLAGVAGGESGMELDRLGLSWARVGPGLALELLALIARFEEAGALHLETEARLASLVARLACGADRPGVDATAGPGGSVAARRAVARVRELIEERSGEDLTTADLARAAGLSPYHLIRSFTRVHGIPPHVCLVLARLRHARRLIRQGASLALAATEAGFYDQSHLTGAFRRYMTMTPGRYAGSR